MFVEQVFLESTREEEEEAPPDWISFWKPNMTISFVDDFTKYDFLHAWSLAVAFVATWALSFHLVDGSELHVELFCLSLNPSYQLQ